MTKSIIHLDHLTNICGFSTSETYANNGYGCNHPKQEETDFCNLNNKQQGKCYSFSCPVAYAADLEDMEILDKTLYDQYKDEEYSPLEIGADYMVVNMDKINSND